MVDPDRPIKSAVKPPDRSVQTTLPRYPDGTHDWSCRAPIELIRAYFYHYHNPMQ